MKRFTLVQELPTTVDEHWRIYFDDAFERGLYLEGMRFPTYELLEHHDSAEALHRKIRVIPRLDAPAAVTKILGARFAYVEDGTFDKGTRILRSRVIPSVMPDRIHADFTVTAEPAGEGRCRRTVVTTVDVRIFGVGGVIESVFEKSMREGWRDSATFMTEWLRRHPPPA
jgi:hypothetical protein